MNDTTYGRQLNYLKMRVSLDVEMEPLVDRDMDIGAEGSLQTPSARPGTKRRGIWILREVVGFTNRALKSKDANLARKRGLMSFIFGFTTSKSDSLRETAWLDGLRGIAAFLVMVYHFNLDTFAYGTEGPYAAPGTHLWEIWRLPYLRIIWCSGHVQVGVFFVLSGFVLSWSSLSSIREGRYEKLALSLSSSVFRRWIRLFVPCFLIGTISLVLFYTGGLELPMTKEASFLAQVVDYFWECKRFSDPLHLERDNWQVLFKYDPVMWTIPLEWAGSLTVFLVLIMVARIRNYRKRTIVLAFVPIYCCVSARWNYWLFTTGMLLADYVQQAGGFEQLSNRMTRGSRFFWIIVLLLSGLIAGIPQRRDWYERPGYDWTDKLVPNIWMSEEAGGRFLWCWAGIMAVWGFAHFATIRRFFERPTCRYLGKISFMLYLTHRIIGTALGFGIRRHILNVLGTHWSDPDQPEKVFFTIRGFFWNIVAYILFWVFTLPLVLALANWSTVLVDEPSVRFAKWVDDKFVGGSVTEHMQRAAGNPVQ